MRAGFLFLLSTGCFTPCLLMNKILGNDNIMMLRKILFFILGMGLIAPAAAIAELVAEEPVDNKWGVSLITENSVHASVNGQVTHGDGLHIRLVKGHCEKGNLLTFVYSYANHPEIEQLQGRYVPTDFMGGEVVVKILYTSPFLMGHRAVIDMGWVSIAELQAILAGKNPITMEYKDSSELKITDYFDIPHNSWSNEGVKAALNRAVVMCEKL